jgi:hypothetical protein
MKKIHIFFVMFAAAAIASFVYFYEYPAINAKYEINCNYFGRVADVHWAEAKVYANLQADAASKGDTSDALALGREQFQKQTLAEQWESQYQDCNKK